MDKNDNNILKPGILLFSSSLIFSILSWISWIVVSRFTSTEEIGFATTVISLMGIFTGLSLLGWDYTLLKESTISRGKAFGSLTVISITINLGSLPVFIIIGNYMFGETIDSLLILLGGISYFLTFLYVARHVLMGTLSINILIISDFIGMGVRFSVLISLLLFEYGAYAILYSIIAQSIVTVTITNVFSLKKMGFSLGNTEYIKHLFKSGISNFPPKISRLLLGNLSVILLAVISTNPAIVGIFYIIFMISTLGTSLGTNLSQISIPVQNKSKTDVVSYSTRIGLGFTVPVITLVVIVPNWILILFGEDFLTADTPLAILGLSMFPSIIYANTIAKLNTLKKFKELAILGIAELVIFIPTFLILTEYWELFGSAVSILITFTVIALYSLRYMNKEDLKILGFCVLSLLCGIGSGVLFKQGFNNEGFALIISMVITVAILLIAKVIEKNDIKEIIQVLTKRE